MIILSGTSDKLKITTSAALNTDVQVSWVDYASGTTTFGRTNTSLTTATTADILGSPAANTQRNAKRISVLNKSTSTSQGVIIIHTDGTNTVNIHRATLLPEGELVISESSYQVVGTLALTGALTVSGAVTLAGALTVAGAVTVVNNPSCRVYNSANISITNGAGALQVITFNSELWDTASMHSTSSNTDRLVAPVAGKYEVKAGMRFASNGTGYRQIVFEKNGGTPYYGSVIFPGITGVVTDVMGSVLLDLAANDYVRILVGQSSGGALNVENSDYVSPWASMHRVIS